MIKGKHFILQQQDGSFLPTLLKAGPVGQSKHQRRPRDLGVSGQEVGTKCSEDTKDEIRQQCVFPPTHIMPLAQGFSNPGDSPSFQTLSRNFFSLIPPLGCKWPQAGCTPVSHSSDFSFCLQRYQRQAGCPLFTPVFTVRSIQKLFSLCAAAQGLGKTDSVVYHWGERLAGDGGVGALSKFLVLQDL